MVNPGCTCPLPLGPADKFCPTHGTTDPIERNRLLLQELQESGRTGQPMRIDRRGRRTPRKVRDGLRRFREALRLADETISDMATAEIPALRRRSR